MAGEVDATGCVCVVGLATLSTCNAPNRRLCTGAFGEADISLAGLAAPTWPNDIVEFVGFSEEAPAACAAVLELGTVLGVAPPKLKLNGFALPAVDGAMEIVDLESTATDAVGGVLRVDVGLLRAAVKSVFLGTSVVGSENVVLGIGSLLNAACRCGVSSKVFPWLGIAELTFGD